MAEQRNIVVVGASISGLQSAHSILKHILPVLKSKGGAKYHVYVINPSSTFYFRNASPRVAASSTLLGTEKVIYDLHKGFTQYSKEDFTLIEASATGLDTSAREILYRRSKATDDERLPYFALIIATGSKTHYPAFSMSTDTQATLQSLKWTNEKVVSAKDIIIVGGGPTSVEFAAEAAEFRNGTPRWFSKTERKVNVTIITAGDRLLSNMRPAIAKTAEQKLHTLGVKIMYNTRVTDTTEGKDGRTVVNIAKGDKLEADLYIPAFGVVPNSSWLPPHLLDNDKYLKTNPGTVRVDEAGPRVYAMGDVASYSGNTTWEIMLAMPVLLVNLKRDLLSFNPAQPDARPKGKDRLYKADTRETQIIPIGTKGGVGAIMGWRLPNFIVWYLKSRDYMVAMAAEATLTGDNVKKEVVWTAEESAI
ncbi:FAD/NAD(P)-binding domain-containing protein [Dothidotthia symphoricarpi CBS 119687]|uniref:FAD/NAD(P)-binding domain-containing protein n=1 Tax=Dothidotthia symphoricarpi CBS 119687 TaxID=1392245 RepID=A0A6A6A5M1_9PLEO|nr:FAD/NAD(P)-binding domain-containing protein [Dothidotthia symphoricarpi CBS 119687]KAF2126207.1 FAD/NAD(P)-binding domain-containing protein [Dothidotthia symphoricarpi CBS 119687]